MEEFQLYEIAKDPREQNDLAGSMPEKLAKMKKTLFEVWNNIEAEGPKQWWHDGKEKPARGSTVAY